MKYVILRLNVGDFGKIGTYNVQETGLANALIKKGNLVNVLFLNRSVDTIQQDETYSYVYYLPHKSIGLHGIFNTDLLANFDPERIILFSDNQFWAKNVILWCKKHKILCVHYFGNVLSDNKRWLNQTYTKLILLRNKKSYNFSINVAKTRKVQKEMDLLKVHCKQVINIGLDETILNSERNLNLAIRREIGICDDELAILFIGRLIDYKRPLLACDILKELQKRNVKAKLIIIGKGMMEDTLSKYISDNGLSEYIIWEKNVPYQNIYKYMVSCDCCINLSTIEIFGMTILEAMYYGIPMVAQHAPGPDEIIENEKSGLLLDSNDPVIWVDNVLKAVNNRVALGNREHERIMSSFTWSSIAEEFENVFEVTI